MENVSHCAASGNGLALSVAAFIFFVTLFMVAKQWIGFGITVILLLFSLIAGLIIANQDIIRNGLSGAPTEQAKDFDLKMTHFNEQILKAHDNLKAELEIQKHKLQTLTEEVDELKKSKSS